MRVLCSLPGSLLAVFMLLATGVQAQPAGDAPPESGVVAEAPAPAFDQTAELRRKITEFLENSTGLKVSVGPISGALLSNFEARDVSASDDEGTVVTIDFLRLEWTPRDLLQGRLAVRRLDVRGLTILRPLRGAGTAAADFLPEALGEAAGEDADLPEGLPPVRLLGFEIPRLPVEVAAGNIRFSNVRLAAPVLGRDITLDMSAQAIIPVDERPVEIAVEINRSDGREGRAVGKLEWQRESSRVALVLGLAEGPGGLTQYLLGLPAERRVEFATRGEGNFTSWLGDIRLQLEDLLLTDGRLLFSGSAGQQDLLIEGRAAFDAAVRAAYPDLLEEAPDFRVKLSYDRNRTAAVEEISVLTSFGRIDGTGSFTAQTGALNLTARAQVPDLSKFSRLVGRRLSGAADVLLDVADFDGTRGIDVLAEGQNVTVDQVRLRDVEGRLEIRPDEGLTDLVSKADLRAILRFTGISLNGGEEAFAATPLTVRLDARRDLDRASSELITITGPGVEGKGQVELQRGRISNAALSLTVDDLTAAIPARLPLLSGGMSGDLSVTPDGTTLAARLLNARWRTATLDRVLGPDAKFEAGLTGGAQSDLAEDGTAAPGAPDTREPGDAVVPGPGAYRLSPFLLTGDRMTAGGVLSSADGEIVFRGELEMDSIDRLPGIGVLVDDGRFTGTGTGALFPGGYRLTIDGDISGADHRLDVFRRFLGTSAAARGNVSARDGVTTMADVVLSSGGNRVEMDGTAEPGRLDLKGTGRAQDILGLFPIETPLSVASASPFSFSYGLADGTGDLSAEATLSGVSGPDAWGPLLPESFDVSAQLRIAGGDGEVLAASARSDGFEADATFPERWMLSQGLRETAVTFRRSLNNWKLFSFADALTGTLGGTVRVSVRPDSFGGPFSVTFDGQPLDIAADGSISYQRTETGIWSVDGFSARLTDPAGAPGESGIRPADGTVSGRITGDTEVRGAQLQLNDLSLALLRAGDTGRISGQLDLTPLAGGLTARADLAGEDLAIRLTQAGMPVTVEQAALQLQAEGIQTLPLRVTNLNASLEAAGVRQGGIFLRELKAKTAGPSQGLSTTVTFAGQQTREEGPALPFGATAQLIADISEPQQLRARVATLAGRYNRWPFALAEPAEVLLSPAGYQLTIPALTSASALLRLRGGVVNGLAGFEISASVPRLQDFDSGTGDRVTDGAADLQLRIDGPADNPDGIGSVYIRRLRFPLRSRPDAADSLLPELDANATLLIGNRSLLVNGRISGARDLEVNGSVQLPLRTDLSRADVGIPRDAPVAGQFGGDFNLFELGEYLGLEDTALSGRFSFENRLAGTLQAPRVEGAYRIIDGRFEDLEYGLIVDDINIDGIAAGDRVLFRSNAPGPVRIEGQVELDPGRNFPVSVRAALSEADIVQRDDASLLISGGLQLNGALRSNLLASGDLLITEAEVSLPDLSGPVVTRLDVIEINRPASLPRPVETERQASGILADIRIRSGENLIFRGGGVNTKWRADLTLQGPLNRPVLTGGIINVDGSLTVLGKRFDVTRGTVSYNGDRPGNPGLDLVAERQSGDVLIILEVSGTAERPEVGVRSVPELETDDVLARLLFNQRLDQIDALQAVELVTALTRLQNLGRSDDFVERLRSLTGLDSLSLAATDGEDTRLRAGKQIGDNLQVWVEQGLGTQTSRVGVRANVTPSFSVETDYGLDAVGNVRLNWSLDY